MARSAIRGLQLRRICGAPMPIVPRSEAVSLREYRSQTTTSYFVLPEDGLHPQRARRECSERDTRSLDIQIAVQLAGVAGERAGGTHPAGRLAERVTQQVPAQCAELPDVRLEIQQKRRLGDLSPTLQPTKSPR